MIVDPKKWLDTLPTKKYKSSENINEIVAENFINTLPEKKINNGTKVYSIVVFLFVLGLISVSLIKNKTRSLQKEINNLQTKIGSLKLELHQSELDYQFLSSPKNISELAEKYLDYDLATYKKSQINKLDEETKYYAKLKLNKQEKKSNKKYSDKDIKLIKKYFEKYNITLSKKKIIDKLSCDHDINIGMATFNKIIKGEY